MLFNKTSENFKMVDQSSSWYSYGSIQYYSDKSIKINLSIYHNTNQDSIYVICLVNSFGELTTTFDGFNNDYDNFIEYVNFLIDSILKHLKS